MTTYEKVVELIVENLGVDKESVKPESDLMEDLGADSLDAVELSMAIEDEFDVEVEDEDFAKLKTIQDVVDYLESL